MEHAMNVTIVKADPSRLAECREVFLDSALYDHYFTAEGRLEGMLATAVEKGELWLAVTSRNEVAGVMWMEMTGFFDVNDSVSVKARLGCILGFCKLGTCKNKIKFG